MLAARTAEQCHKPQFKNTNIGYAGGCSRVGSSFELRSASPSKLAHRVEDGIGDRTDMGMNSLKIAQDVDQHH
jgi:hypothetical protein